MHVGFSTFHKYVSDGVLLLLRLLVHPVKVRERALPAGSSVGTLPAGSSLRTPPPSGQSETLREYKVRESAQGGLNGHRTFTQDNVVTLCR